MFASVLSQDIGVQTSPSANEKLIQMSSTGVQTYQLILSLMLKVVNKMAKFLMDNNQIRLKHLRTTN